MQDLNHQKDLVYFLYSLYFIVFVLYSHTRFSSNMNLYKGLHRYTLLTYKQPTGRLTYDSVVSRRNWNLT